ncbi:MAG: hypothetical protein ACK5LJ_07700 [Paracoccus sp. (in: a-proteobacteria)]
MADEPKMKTTPLPELEADKAESWVQFLPAGKCDMIDDRGP